MTTVGGTEAVIYIGGVRMPCKKWSMATRPAMNDLPFQGAITMDLDEPGGIECGDFENVEMVLVPDEERPGTMAEVQFHLHGYRVDWDRTTDARRERRASHA